MAALISGAGILPRPIAEQEANNEPQEAASSSAYVRPDGRRSQRRCLLPDQQQPVVTFNMTLVYRKQVKQKVILFNGWIRGAKIRATKLDCQRLIVCSPQ